MTRRKLSEYRSKILIAKVLNQPYDGWCIDFKNDLQGQLSQIKSHEHYVVKVDQGIKGRYKKGLVVLGVSRHDIESVLLNLHNEGYDTFIVEPQIKHEKNDERYVAFLFEKNGVYLSFNSKGGVEIESNTQNMSTYDLTDLTLREQISSETGFSQDQLNAIVDLFNKGYMTMLEINPYVIEKAGVKPLDIAIEVDDAGAYFTSLWSEADFRRASSNKITEEERTVREMDEKSPASLKLEMINPNGSIFLLLSGGGASVVVADEVDNLGFGKQLANYGEYSGNPNTEETYLYTVSLLKLLVASDAPRKVLFIGGAVANFTDIADTFTGIIRAIDELAVELSAQKVKIFVRRGGPRQEVGLDRIRKTLEKYDLLGAVHGPSVPITKVVAEALEGMVL